MLTTIVYIDDDACPVKEEVYRVADRYKLKVLVVANQWMNIPASPSQSRIAKLLKSLKN